MYILATLLDGGWERRRRPSRRARSGREAPRWVLAPACTPRARFDRPLPDESACPRAGRPHRFRPVEQPLARADALSPRGDVDVRPRRPLAVEFHAADAVIWDVDGTLADSTELGFTSTNAVLTEANLPAITLAQYMVGTRYATPQRLAWHATGDVDHPSGVELGAAFDRHYIALVSLQTAGFFPGVADLVAALAAVPNKSQAVLSNACGEYARAVMAANDVAKHMTLVHGADDAPRVKPAPDGLLAQCEAMGWQPARCVYVGDSPSDGAAAAPRGCDPSDASGARTTESRAREASMRWWRRWTNSRRCYWDRERGDGKGPGRRGRAPRMRFT